MILQDIQKLTGLDLGADVSLMGLAQPSSHFSGHPHRETLAGLLRIGLGFAALPRRLGAFLAQHLVRLGVDLALLGGRHATGIHGLGGARFGVGSVGAIVDRIGAVGAGELARRQLVARFGGEFCHFLAPNEKPARLSLCGLRSAWSEVGPDLQANFTRTAPDSVIWADYRHDSCRLQALAQDGRKWRSERDRA